ncbi:MAG: bifunctional methylenetetrahydrofolate dehydrogenase/methenyltetrahydrofolate cyclohydrolase FolD [Acutalibacteraceae bacterium]|nr:bifunctional methylenetetrahydrofolate dehydrogenase/methenyltetrahydrofolate cyclohydrolase FolD [Acutalibacteraceae bacterium]
MYKLIDGKEVSAFIKNQVKQETDKLREKGIEVSLAVIIVGNDPASRVYVNNKKKACEATGIISYEYALPEETTQDELLGLIEKLNADEKINGILCQLPLPSHIDEQKVIDTISPLKDVDCFHAVNVGKLWLGDYDFASCTPMGVIHLLDYYNIDVTGKNCVIVGRSNIVGKPMASLLLEKSATVTVCHSKTQNLTEFTSNADVIIAAVGRAKFITADMVKDGAVVIDVGINRDENGKLCGDVDFENVKEKASYITPVPGGCGPMTIAVLMKNTLVAAEIQGR